MGSDAAYYHITLHRQFRILTTRQPVQFCALAVVQSSITAFPGTAIPGHRVTRNGLMIPNSRATRAISLPVFLTIRTAPSLTWIHLTSTDQFRVSWIPGMEPRTETTAGWDTDWVGFATKPQLAINMLSRAHPAGGLTGWVTADEVYGQHRAFATGHPSAHPPTEQVSLVLAPAVTTPFRCQATGVDWSGRWPPRSPLRHVSGAAPAPARTACACMTGPPWLRTRWHSPRSAAGA